MARINYQELFTVIVGRHLDFDNPNDKKVAMNLNIFFSDRDDYVVSNGNCVVNQDFYKTLTNSKGRTFSATEAKIAEFLRKNLAQRRYSQDQKETLIGYMAVARKMSYKRDEQQLIYELRIMYEGVYNHKPDEITSTLMTDAVRINLEMGRTFFGVSPRVK